MRQAPRTALAPRERMDEILVLPPASVAAPHGPDPAALTQVARAGAPRCSVGGVRSAADARRLLAAGAARLAVDLGQADFAARLRGVAAEAGAARVDAVVDLTRHQTRDPALAAALGVDPAWEVLQMPGPRRTARDAVDAAADAVHAGAARLLVLVRDLTGRPAPLPGALRAELAELAVPVCSLLPWRPERSLPAEGGALRLFGVHPAEQRTDPSSAA